MSRGTGLQDFYKTLKIHRNASQNEIKNAYRKLAFTLHPDRHDGCNIKINQFKSVTEAYQTLSNHSKRRQHDQNLNNRNTNNNGYYNNKNRSTPPPPNYRKVYTAAPPPPGFKTFNAKTHYDMHYGDGMMKEEIERARKRAQAASEKGGPSFGYEYVSPLGKGFSFSGGGGGGMGGGNPYSKSGRLNRQNNNKGDGGNSRSNGTEFEYEEGYMDMGNNSQMSSKHRIRGREIIAERMKERRKFRRRNRGDSMNPNSDDACVVM
mmetsp:Transcript_27173/g.31071  ORF Transcript_27173/g.31071 Transcript_27173/m.31071 type:complete len:263 (+) Transcript_27173:350-1138(+)